MATYRIMGPDGATYQVNAPDSASEAEVLAYAKANYGKQATKAEPPKTTIGQDIKQGIGNLVAGGVRGAGSIGATLLAPIDMIGDAIDGKGLSLESNRKRRADMDAGLASMGADPDSLLYHGGKLAGEIAGTAGMGSAIAAPLKAAGVALRLTQAIATSGMRTGAPAAQTRLAALADMAIRSTGGAVSGAGAAGLVDPDSMMAGAGIGAALPPAIAGAGKAGRALGSAIRGPAVPADVQAAVQAARQAGYVIPPTQAKPSLANRLLEGTAGKITTAQNASARNQQVTNDLAKRAIGARELTPEGLQEVRNMANAAYSELGAFGQFTADDVFHSALDKAGASSAAMKENFGALVNKDVDALIGSLKDRSAFDSQATIEAIKQLRAEAGTNKAAMDPAKKAYGRAQNKIASALEDLIERNLTAAGNPELLTNYRSARQTLAKVYDVEKALNAAGGNVDARKLAKQLGKGRPMTGDLRTAAEFAAKFPKAAQVPEGMGSLPGVSPLDVGALGMANAVTGNPAVWAALMGRPLARSAALSAPVQNRLVQPQAQGLMQMIMGNPTLEQLMYQSAPQFND